MGRILISELKKKYGSENITKGKYQNVINDILTYNRDKIIKDIATMTDKKIKNSLSVTDRNLVKFPIIQDIAKKHDLLVLKAADRGQFITQTLRDRLTQDLRDTLAKMPDTTKIPQSLIKEFKYKALETFQAYTKDDPVLKIPPQIRNIAVTEVKSAVNNIRKIYMDDLLSRNPEYEYKKTWKHYKSYSKEYRRGHEEQNGVTIDRNDKFKVREFKKVKGVWKPTGRIILMDRPHDDTINEPGQEIGCSCECKYKLIKKPNVNIKKGINSMITIKPSYTADSRTSDYKNVTKQQLLQSSLQHIEDVKKGLYFISGLLVEASGKHDFDKIRYINEFHSDFITGFEQHEWWDRHKKLNRHHLQKEDGIPQDVNLIDVIEMIVDCVMAGMARSGEVYKIEINPDILIKSFNNTVEMFKSNVEIKI